MVRDSLTLRRAVIATARAMNAAGINVNKSGNVSARCVNGSRQGLVVTPSAVPYDALKPADLVFVVLTDGAARGKQTPSTEWRFHRDIYAARSDVAAIVHAHPVSATALACHDSGIPPFHYMVAAAGGRDIRCARYATFGTQELSDAVVNALEGRRACLLSHHGLIACGPSLDRALTLAIEIENLARTYLAARSIGEPPLLDDAEMARVLERFQSYGN